MASTRGRVAGVFTVIVIPVAVLVIAYIVAATTLDNVDEKWITCTVTSSAPAVGGSKTPVYSVKLATSCGKVAVYSGIASGNVDKVAREFAPNSAYEFELGWFSRSPLRLDATATAQHWRKAPR